MEKLLVKDIHDSQFEAWEGARTKRPEDDDEDENDDDEDKRTKELAERFGYFSRKGISFWEAHLSTVETLPTFRQNFCWKWLFY